MTTVKGLDCDNAVSWVKPAKSQAKQVLVDNPDFAGDFGPVGLY